MSLKLSEEQIKTVIDLAHRIEASQRHEAIAVMEYDLAKDQAEKLLESFRGQDIPEAIVINDLVLKINHAMLTADYARPIDVFRLVHNSVVIRTGGDDQ